VAKRIMRRFRINEISAVDEPAQQPAKALLMKRRTGPDDQTLVAAVAKHQAEIREQRQDNMRHEAVAKHQKDLRAEKGASYERAPLPSINVAGPQESGLTVQELDSRIEQYARSHQQGIETVDGALGRLAAQRDPTLRELYAQREALVRDKHAGYTSVETKQ
jgi:hypothetical protein